MNRRVRFREYMARLNAAASPRQALDSGFYVPPPADLSIAHELSARLELQPASTHLVIGGVGSGKTTELLAAREKFESDNEIFAVYIDVSELYDLAHFNGDTLIFSLIRGLAARLESILGENLKVAAALSNFGKWRSAETTTEEDAQTFAALLSAYKSINRVPVAFIDSLDRLSDPVKLETALRQHSSIIRNGNMGLVLAGSIRLRHGLDRTMRDLFDQTYSAPYVSIDDPAGLAFLSSVLRARVPELLLDNESCALLAKLSGGVLRDLLTLAQAAVGEAYVRGGDQVTSQHIRIAADGFGRKQMLGLDSKEIATLQSIRSSESFVQTSAKDLGLLLTRHVLEYQDALGKPIYRVHPTLKPLLEQIAEAE